MKRVDKEDKALDRQRRKEKRLKEKMKRKRGKYDDEDAVGSEDDPSLSDREALTHKAHKKGKIYFDSDSDDGEKKKNKDTSGVNADTDTLAEQEALALKLLSSMHP